MATRIEILNDTTFHQIIDLASIKAARLILAEAASTDKAHLRKDLARRILSSPSSMTSIFASFIVMDLTTTQLTNWGTYTEDQKIDGARDRILAVWNEAGNI